MSKVIVIECCWDCRHLHPVVDWMGKCEKINKGVANPKERIPDWCPLPDLPERLLCEGDSERIKNFRLEARKQGIELRMGSFGWGWNACLDAITGGKEA